MAITKEDIERLADLARLNLTPEEIGRLTGDMETIINYSMSKLNELNTDDVLPMEHVLPIRNVFREDICEKSFDREEILKNAPEKAEGCFLVPKVVE